MLLFLVFVSVQNIIVLPPQMPAIRHPHARNGQKHLDLLGHVLSLGRTAELFVLGRSQATDTETTPKRREAITLNVDAQNAAVTPCSSHLSRHVLAPDVKVRMLRAMLGIDSGYSMHVD